MIPQGDEPTGDWRKMVQRKSDNFQRTISKNEAFQKGVHYTKSKSRAYVWKPQHIGILLDQYERTGKASDLEEKKSQVAAFKKTETYATINAMNETAAAAATVSPMAAGEAGNHA